MVNIKEIERWIIKFANAKRKKEGMKPFRTDEGLTWNARDHSKVMAQHDTIFHSEGASEGVFNTGTIENVALLSFRTGTRTARDWGKAFHITWMTSRGHSKNILDPKLLLIGVGVSKRGTTFYATQQFSEENSKNMYDDDGEPKHLFQKIIDSFFK